jgi:hypothetical protein
MKTDTLAMDTHLLLSVLSFCESYKDEKQANLIRRHWRAVARKSKIRIQTFDNTQQQEIIIIRLDTRPHDEYLKQAQRKYDRQNIDRYIAQHTQSTPPDDE